jgi:hypothetical protein
MSGARVKFASVLSVSRGLPEARRGIEVPVPHRSQRLADDVRWRAGADGGPHLGDQTSEFRDLAGCGHGGVSGEDLFDQGRARPRHAEHEDRLLRGIAVGAQRFHERHIDCAFERGDEAQLGRRVIAHLGAFEGVPGGEMAKRVVVAPGILVRFGESEVEVDLGSAVQPARWRAQGLHCGEPRRLERFGTAADELQVVVAVAGIDRDRAFEPDHRLADRAGLEQDAPQIAGRVAEGGVEVEGRAEGGGRRFRFI